MSISENSELQPMKRIQVGPISILDASADNIVNFCTANTPPANVIMNLNANALNIALRDNRFRFSLQSSNICFCDGFGIVLLARALKYGRIAHRNTPPDFIDAVYEKLKRCAGTVFLLGDEEPAIRRYAEKVKRNFPGILAGFHHGFFELESEENERLVSKIADLSPTLILVGMGMPRQEFWVMENKSRIPETNILTVGALFSWGTSGRKRGPRWMTDHGMEWLARLFLEPRRVWARYFIGLPQVMIRLLIYRFQHGVPGATERIAEARLPKKISGVNRER